MENLERAIILKQPSIEYDDRAGGTLYEASADVDMVCSVKAMYDLAVESGTDPSTLVVNNSEVMLAGKTLKTLYDEGVQEVVVSAAINILSLGGGD